MAQVGIREFDAKKMYFDFVGEKYTGEQIEIKDNKMSSVLLGEKKYVVKPDMLFGGRGKLNLLGIGLKKDEIKDWIEDKTKIQTKVGSISGDLTHFLVEDFVPHNEEYYVSFSSARDYDLINFSFEGGVEIEENWEKVIEIKIPTLEDLTEEIIEKEIFGNKKNIIPHPSGAHFNTKESIIKTILNLWKFYKNYGFVYLEVNPFCFKDIDKTSTEGFNPLQNLVLLDMVAKIDDTEFFRQKENWKNIDFPSTFGFTQSPEEKYIKELDEQTGASLKFKILNRNAKIWTLLAGGGGSLVMTDTLGALGFSDEIGNYGELSGNPTREFTREYTQKLLDVMLANKIKGKYLIIAGAIANFTDIKNTFSGMIDIFEKNAEEMKKQEIKILVRRGGINEKIGLKIMKENCEKLGISCQIADSGEYMTEILKEIKI